MPEETLTNGTSEVVHEVGTEAVSAIPSSAVEATAENCDPSKNAQQAQANAAAQPKAGLFASWKKNPPPKSDDPLRFSGEGVDFRAKLIGIRDVGEPRGDQMCQDAMQIAKAMVKASGQHKQKITVNISLEGLKIRDAISNQVLYSFPVHRISFIARDVTDGRAFGFVYGTPESQHKFYAIKTERTSDVVVLSIRDMFHIVYEMKKRQIEDVKKGDGTDESSTKTDQNANETPGGIADLLNLESELQTLKQGITDLAWVSVTDNKEMGSGANISTGSSSGYTGLNLNETTSSSSDIFGGSGSHEDPFSTSSGHFGQNAGGTSSNPFLVNAVPQYQGQNSMLIYGANASFTAMATPPGQMGMFQSPTVIPPSANASSGFGMSTTDPFDTSRIPRQMMQSTPAQMATSPMFLGGHSGAINSSMPPSSIRPDDSNLSMLGNSAFPFSTSGFDSTASLGQSHSTTANDFSALNNAMSGSQLGGSATHQFNAQPQPSFSTGSLFDEPLAPLSTGALADPAPPPKKESTQQDFQRKAATPPGTLDDAFNSLCSLDDLSLGGGAAFKGTVKQSPFEAANKGQTKKTINAMRGSEGAGVAPVPLQQQPMFQQQSAMPTGGNAAPNPFLAGGMAPTPQFVGGMPGSVPVQPGGFPNPSGPFVQGHGQMPPMQMYGQSFHQFPTAQGGHHQQPVGNYPPPVPQRPMDNFGSFGGQQAFAGAVPSPLGRPPGIGNRQPPPPISASNFVQSPIGGAPQAQASSFMNDDFFK